jgi:hypothetical protein
VKGAEAKVSDELAQESRKMLSKLRGICSVGTVDLVYTMDNTSGASAITVSDVAIGSTLNVSDFFVSTALPVNIEPGKTKTLDLSFAIVAAGRFSLAMVLANNDITENPYNITITGAGMLYVDINGDGEVDLHDVRRCMAIAEGCALTTPGELARADVDGDGDVDAIDVEILAEKVLGL